MKVKTLWYFTKEAFIGLSRNGLMSLAALITITLSLVILGCFFMVISNFNHFAEMAKGVLELRVYLTEDANPSQLQERIIEIEGVKDVRFVSKLEGAKWLETSLGVKDLFSNSDNPLPDMINIKLKEDAVVKPLVEELGTLDGVEEVVYGKTFVEAMIVLIKIIWIIGIGLIAIIGLVVLYIIVNTIRLTVIARWKEIEIMKLVGATDWFIRWPFMFEGIFLGLCGAFISILLLSKTYHFVYEHIRNLAPFVPMIHETNINNGLLLLLTAVGTAFGAIGSMVSIKKFLRV